MKDDANNLYDYNLTNDLYGNQPDALDYFGFILEDEIEFKLRNRLNNRPKTEFDIRRRKTCLNNSNQIKNIEIEWIIIIYGLKNIYRLYYIDKGACHKQMF
jgi:hypothetical protein